MATDICSPHAAANLIYAAAVAAATGGCRYSLDGPNCICSHLSNLQPFFVKCSHRSPIQVLTTLSIA